MAFAPHAVFCPLYQQSPTFLAPWTVEDRGRGVGGQEVGLNVDVGETVT